MAGVARLCSVVGFDFGAPNIARKVSPSAVSPLSVALADLRIEVVLMVGGAALFTAAMVVVVAVEGAVNDGLALAHFATGLKVSVSLS